MKKWEIPWIDKRIDKWIDMGMIFFIIIFLVGALYFLIEIPKSIERRETQQRLPLEFCQKGLSGISNSGPTGPRYRLWCDHKEFACSKTECYWIDEEEKI